MKLTIERAALLKALAHAQSVVERRNTIPILSNVKLTAKGDRLSLDATDLDLEIVEQADCQSGVDGATTVAAHTLYDIVRKLPEGSQIELDTGGETERMSLRAGRSRFTLTCLPVEDFPVMSEGDLPHQFRLA